MIYLISSADDFGLYQSMNRGIAKAYEEGMVTSINVMSTGNAFADGVSLLKSIKPEEIGAHLVLTNEGYLRFIFKFFRGEIKRDEIYAELKAQLDKLSGIGIRITSLSGHEHIHMIPAILDIFITLAKEYNIPAIRCLKTESLIPPVNLKKIYKKMIISYFGKSMAKRLTDAAILHTDRVLGFLDSENITEELLVNMLSSLGSGTTELVSHPGYLSPEVVENSRFHRNCESDLAALTSRRVKNIIKTRQIELVTYGKISSGPDR